jgi:hypothetical protein
MRIWPPTPQSERGVLTRRALVGGSSAALLAGASVAGASVAASALDRRYPILDLAGPPGLDASARRAYADFLLMDLPRAFAIGAGGRVGVAGGALSTDQAGAEAIAACQGIGGGNARIYAQDLSVVWHGPAPPVAAARAPLISTWNYSFAPDSRFFWYGPGAGRGLYVWAHGTSTDPLGLQPPPHVRAFNNAGFDIVRFDRIPNADEVTRATQWLRAGIASLRAMGWTYVIAGGHSRGAWNCLQMLDTADLADVVIAESPAAHGMGGSLFLSSQTDDVRQIVQNVPKTRTRLAFVQFADDPFIGDPDQRRQLIEALRGRVSGLLVIDRPPGFSGHLAARALAFAERFGSDLLGLAT